MLDKLKHLTHQFNNQLNKVNNQADLEHIRVKFLGRRGLINELIKEIVNLPADQKAAAGRRLNQLKLNWQKQIQQKKAQLETAATSLKPGFIPYLPTSFGRIHPVEWMRRRTLEIFNRLGFIEFQGPHIENDWYNFEGLNIPPGHPARDLWDTLYVNLTDKKGKPLLLRTHTSNIQLRALQTYGVPLRVMAFDRCFRHEVLDPRHSHTFSQFEVLVVDKGINMTHLKWLSDYFLKRILGEVTESRFRPKYYPFVEPGVGVDAKCIFCAGKGCRICSDSGWFEIAGAGMVHPQVLKNAGVDPSVYSGFAWGFGPDRMLMLLTGTADIRNLYQGGLRFLRG